MCRKLLCIFSGNLLRNATRILIIAMPDGPFSFGEIPLYSAFYEGGWLYQKVDRSHALDIERGMLREFDPRMLVGENTDAPFIIGSEVDPYPACARHQLAC